MDEIFIKLIWERFVLLDDIAYPLEIRREKFYQAYREAAQAKDSTATDPQHPQPAICQFNGPDCGYMRIHGNCLGLLCSLWNPVKQAGVR